MGLEITVFGEVCESNGWRPFGIGELSIGFDLDLGFPKTDPPCLFWSTNRALMAILGARRKGYCSVGEFEQLPVSSEIPVDCSPEIVSWMFEESSVDDQKGWIGFEELLRFPFSKKTIVREAYVPKDTAHLFGSPAATFPYDRWPTTIPISYSTMSRQGSLVRWTETYTEAMGEDFFKILELVKTIEPALPKRFVFVID